MQIVMKELKMSICGIRLKSVGEKDRLQAELVRNAEEGLRLFRTEQRISRAFRCASKFGSMLTLHMRDFISMAEQCRWCALCDVEDEGDNSRVDRPDNLFADESNKLYLSDPQVLDDASLLAEQEKLAAQMRRNIALERAGQQSAVAALWRESVGTKKSSRGPPDMDLVRFDVRSSIG
ncbi:MAG: hypothetical protein QXW10_04295, partial [Candidatus Micrarchaeaceae archaeon]